MTKTVENVIDIQAKLKCSYIFVLRLLNTAVVIVTTLSHLSSAEDKCNSEVQSSNPPAWRYMELCLVVRQIQFPHAWQIANWSAFHQLRFLLIFSLIYNICFPQLVQ